MGQLSRHTDYVPEGGPVRLPAEIRNLPLLQKAQTDSGDHHRLLFNGHEGSFPGLCRNVGNKLPTYGK